MKKRYLVGAFLCLFAFHASAQSKGSYLKIGVGYQFAVARQAAQFHNFDYDQSGRAMESGTRHSLQNGIAPMVSFGHMFTENIGFEIGVNYLLGASAEVHQQFKNLETSQNHLMKVRSRSLMITPALRFAVPLSKNVSIYSRSGLVIPVLAKVRKTIESIYIEPGTKHDVEISSDVKNRFSLGFTGALGFTFNASKKVVVNVEFAGQMLNLWANKEKIESFKVDNVERKPSQFGFAEETIYVKEMTVDGRLGYAMTYQSPFHSLGINVGLAFGL